MLLEGVEKTQREKEMMEEEGSRSRAKMAPPLSVAVQFEKEMLERVREEEGEMEA